MQGLKNPLARPAGGDVILLFDIAPAISGMLTHALRLAGYIPVEPVEQREVLRWLRLPSHGTPAPLAIIFDMAAPADPSFLRLVAADPPSLVIGIADMGGTDRARLWAQWVTLSLPRPFRVLALQELLQRKPTGAAALLRCPR